MATKADSDGGSTDLFSMLLSDDDEQQTEASSSLAMAEGMAIKEEEEEEQKLYLRSIEATIIIRQLPSQGLSFQLWPAAASLVSILDRDPSALFPSPPPTTAPLRVLELGSGTGLVGIATAAALGAHVTLTDLPHVLPNLRFNAHANAPAVAARAGSVEVRQLRWGSSEDAAALGGAVAFDVVLASDVVYYDHLFDPLLQTLQVFVRGEVAFVMAHLRRWKKRDAVFFRKARKVFGVVPVHTDQPLPGCRTGVTIYGFTAKQRT